MGSLDDLSASPRARGERSLGGAGFRLLRGTLLLLAISALGSYLVLAVIHLRYPFELEWMEGGSVDHVRRIVAGQKLYVKPTLDFAPFIYTPLYFYVAAASAKILGVGFFSARLVSFVSSLVALALVARFVQRETRSPFHGLLAAGLY